VYIPVGGYQCYGGTYPYDQDRSEPSWGSFWFYTSWGANNEEINQCLLYDEISQTVNVFFITYNDLLLLISFYFILWHYILGTILQTVKNSLRYRKELLE
jgi:hypothetical protein